MEIKLCMGSACFARGNAGLLEYLEGRLGNTRLPLRVELCGCRCEEHCGDGPNVFVDGVRHPRMTLERMQALLAAAESGEGRA